MSCDAAIALLNPFENDYPDRDPCSLNGEENAVEATCCAFNNTGTYLAVGCQDGLLVVYDMLTQLPARTVAVHDSRVTSVAWVRSSLRLPRNKKTGVRGQRLGRRGSMVISCSSTGWVKICNLDKSEQLVSVQFNQVVASAIPHPRQPWRWLVSYAETRNFTDPAGGAKDLSDGPGHSSNKAMHWPALVNIGLIGASASEGNDAVDFKRIGLDINRTETKSVNVLNCELMCRKSTETESTTQIEHQVLKRIEALKDKQNAKCAGVVAIWSRKGEMIFVGGLGCTVFVLSGDNGSLLQMCHPATSRGLAPSAWVKSMRLSKNGRFLVTNSIGKIFCLYSVNTGTAKASADNAQVRTLSFQRDFQDTVNNTKWHRCAFSGDSEYVLGAASNKDRHSLYVWDIRGNLMTILEGPSHRGVLRDAVWHPTRPIIVSVDANGEVHLWTKKYSENWSAFAPNFTEIEENVEYVEREDEFDKNPPETPLEESQTGKSDPFEEGPVVDVVTLNQNLHLLSSSSSSGGSSSGESNDKHKLTSCKRTRLAYYIPVVPQNAQPTE